MTLKELVGRNMITRQEELAMFIFGMTQEGQELLRIMMDETIVKAMTVVKSEGKQVDLDPQVLAFSEGRRSFVADICVIIEKVNFLMQQEPVNE